MRLIYFIFTVFMVVTLFQIFWPLIFVFGLLIFLFIAYANYKARQGFKNADRTQYDQPTYASQEQSAFEQKDDSNIEKPMHTGSVIDVEYTERNQNDDKY